MQKKFTEVPKPHGGLPATALATRITVALFALGVLLLALFVGVPLLLCGMTACAGWR